MSDSELLESEQITEYYNYYKQDGLLSSHINNYTYRSEQVALATKISDAFTHKSILLAEAGTGTGKTLAYLVPAILSSNKVIISTGTKNLQNQLYFRDLPLVIKAINEPVSTILLKGRNNYLCKYKLEIALTDILLATSDEVHNLKQIVKWSESTTDGDISTLDSVSEDAGVWRNVTSTIDTCLGNDCPFINNCFVYKARQKAQEAKIIVVNHHLLLSDWCLKDNTDEANLLPNGVNLILDEAHQLPEIASVYFGSNVSSRTIRDLNQDIITEYNHNAKDVKQFANITTAINRLLDKMQQYLTNYPERGYLKNLYSSISSKNPENNFKQDFTDLIELINNLKNVLELNAQRSKGLASCYDRVLTLEQDIEIFKNDADINNNIKWYEIYKNSFAFKLSPLVIDKIFQDKLSRSARACILTSATMTVSNNFDLLKGQLGLGNAKTITIPSPFDYENNALLYIPRSMPDPTANNFIECYAKKVSEIIKISQGRAFLLFTSFYNMHKAYELLSLDESLHSIKFIMQGTASKTALIKKFTDTKKSVLLATSSFWEGVDVKGPDLHCVVIDKLPFSPPNDPLLQSKINHLNSIGKDAFKELQCQQAVIQLAQGAGRLIRSEQDYGVLMICDPRIISRPYGEMFLSSLNNMPRTRDISKIDNFYKRHFIDLD